MPREDMQEPDEHLPAYRPDDCNFTVGWLLGRWFAYSRDLEAHADLALGAELAPIFARDSHDGTTTIERRAREQA